MSERTFYARLGRRIRQARIARGLSQLQLAMEVDYEAGASVSHWESGTLRPNIYTLLRLERVLGTKLHDC